MLVSIAYFEIKEILAFCALFRFPIILVCFITLGSASKICSLFKFVAVIL